jgi:3-isopropylmalate/(R)-2-methylmalate dehydratase small subunit
VVAPSFSDIFTANAFKNGLLPVVLEHGAVQALFEAAARCEYFCLVVDLRAQVVADAAGTRHAFSVPAAQREALLSGTDEIGATLAAAERIAAFERTRLAQQPWV